MEIFDPAWYRLQQPDGPIDKVSALEIFEKVGAAAWCSPSPLFDVAYYLRQAGQEAFSAPFFHYINRGSLAGLNPHPLIDVGAYRARHGLAADVEVLSYGAINPEAPPLNPLFEQAWYEKLRRRSFTSAFAAFSDYVVFGQHERIGPFPLFDPVFFESKHVENDTPAFELYWAELPSLSGDAFPFADQTFLESRALVGKTRQNEGIRAGPVTRLLDPFETEANAVSFSLGTYLGSLQMAKLQPILHTGAAAMASLLSSNPIADQAPASGAWVVANSADSQDQIWNSSGQISSGIDMIEYSSADFLLAGVDKLATKLAQRLLHLAAQPGVGMVGINAKAGAEVTAGATRLTAIPRRDAFAVSRAALESVGGLDSAFATPLAAAADLALRLYDSGYGNIEMAAPLASPETGPPDITDVILLFDRHPRVLETFNRALSITCGASL